MYIYIGRYVSVHGSSLRCSSGTLLYPNSRGYVVISKPKLASVEGRGGDRTTADGSEANVCLYWEHR